MKVSAPRQTLRNRTLIYAVIFIIALILVSTIGKFIHSFSSGYGLFFFCYFVLGCLHAFLIFHNYDHPNGFGRPIALTLIILVISTLFIVLVYQVTEQDYVKGFGISSALITFLFPILSLQVYHNWASIPPREYKKWYYPVGKDLPDMDLLDLTRVLVIQFEFTKKAEDRAFTNFRAKAPVGMLFGELFFIFLNDYNDRNPDSPVKYLDEANVPYGWHFYKKTAWYERDRYIDSDLTFQANGIVDNETIVAVRS